jgi:TRAP-type C4-dicarboxylate transport system substrate-binding protein
MARRAVCAVAAAALVVVASACAGSGPDKAGGQPERPKPADKAVVLTLATGDPPFAEEYAKAVDRLSAGAIRIDIRLGRTAQRNYERFTVEDVRTGRAQLGSVAVRVWDTLGVTSMQALVAPLLVDDLELQKHLLQGPLATRMLRGLDRAGVVGLALTPGPLRRPIGVTRFFAGPKDYRGATMGIKFGNVARATFEALGARVTGYTSGQARFDGAELDLKTIADAKYDPRATAITANVVLWPRPQTIFANRAAFAKLTSGQQEILRRAGREAVPAEAARIAREEKDALSTVCSRSPGVLRPAPASERVALRAAVAPVYAALERVPQTKQLIDAIRTQRGTAQADLGVLRCPGTTNEAAIEGSWRSTVSEEEMRAAGASAAEAASYSGSATLELEDGRWRFRGERAAVTGTYSVEGDQIRLVMRTCTADPCSSGMTIQYRWSVYRNTLALEPSSATTWLRLSAKPATRVR